MCVRLELASESEVPHLIMDHFIITRGTSLTVDGGNLDLSYAKIEDY